MAVWWCYVCEKEQKTLNKVEKGWSPNSQHTIIKMKIDNHVPFPQVMRGTTNIEFFKCLVVVHSFGFGHFFVGDTDYHFTPPTKKDEDFCPVSCLKKKIKEQYAVELMILDLQESIIE